MASHLVACATNRKPWPWIRVTFRQPLPTPSSYYDADDALARHAEAYRVMDVLGASISE